MNVILNVLKKSKKCFLLLILTDYYMVWMVNIYKKMIVQGLSEGKNGYLRSHRTFNSSELRSKRL